MFDFLNPLTAQDLEDYEKQTFTLNYEQWSKMQRAIPDLHNKPEIKKIIQAVDRKAYQDFHKDKTVTVSHEEWLSVTQCAKTINDDKARQDLVIAIEKRELIDKD
ncbi:MAG: hypothetical protein AB7D03_03725 [Thiomicrospira sp.]